MRSASAPLAMRLRDASLWNFPPPTQGLASLILLGIFDRLGVAQPESLAHHHGLIEAVKRAFAIRDGWSPIPPSCVRIPMPGSRPRRSHGKPPPSMRDGQRRSR